MKKIQAERPTVDGKVHVYTIPENAMFLEVNVDSREIYFIVAEPKMVQAIKKVKGKK